MTDFLGLDGLRQAAEKKQSSGVDGIAEPPWFEDLRKLVDAGASVLLVGPPGTGKSHAVETVFRLRNQECAIVSCTPRLTANDLEGAVDLVVEDGRTVTRFNPAAPMLAYTSGMGLLLDEADAAPPEALFSIYRLLERKPAHVVRAGGISVFEPHPDFRVCATQNTKGVRVVGSRYHGRHQQDVAFLDRWDVVIEVDYLPRDVEIAILQQTTGVSADDAEKIVAVAAALRDPERGMQFAATVRRLIAVGKLVAAGMAPEKCWDLAVLSRIPAKDDRAVVEEVLRWLGVLKG